MDFIFAGIRHNFPGMLTEREGEFLAEMCRDKFVLELGSYTGMSTISIARTARHVVACDWHGGDAPLLAGLGGSAHDQRRLTLGEVCFRGNNPPGGQQHGAAYDT